MTRNGRTFFRGDLVQHFKRTMLPKESRRTKYLYTIEGFVTHTETGEQLVVYRSIENDGEWWARPVDMFFGEVDHEKYPDAKQRYVFEDYLYNGEDHNEEDHNK